MQITNLQGLSIRDGTYHFGPNATVEFSDTDGNARAIVWTSDRTGAEGADVARIAQLIEAWRDADRELARMGVLLKSTPDGITWKLV